MTDPCFQTLHWWHCRKHITRFEILVLRFGSLDLSHNQSCSDRFSVILQNQFQSVWAALLFRAFAFRNVVKELLPFPLFFFFDRDRLLAILGHEEEEAGRWPWTLAVLWQFVGKKQNFKSLRFVKKRKGQDNHSKLKG